MSKRVLVIGSGGREHAIASKLSEDPQVLEVVVSPGNAGMPPGQGGKVRVAPEEDAALLCRRLGADLAVVGPEAPLAAGLADRLAAAGVPCFGPSALAARIEADKAWAKAFMERHCIPTAHWRAFTDPRLAQEHIRKAQYPALVVKASGLAAGKGVVVAATRDAACEAVDSMLVGGSFGKAGDTVVVEELLEGEEVSVLGFCDGTTVRAMPPAQDHKRQLDGDRGDNTGGMGAYCPCPLLSPSQLAQVERDVLQRTVDAMRLEGCPFVGVLYAGLMLTEDGPRVLEFNCRFGDPETQVILPLLSSSLYDVMAACCRGELSSAPLEWRQDLFAVGVVMASQGYPGAHTTGHPIAGLDAVSKIPNSLIFYSGVKQQAGGLLLTGGGRVLIAVALDGDLATAAARAAWLCEGVSFAGAQFRRDIAHKGVARWVLERGALTYRASGVDISAGDSLVERIKALAVGTARRGQLGSIGGFGGLFDVGAAGYRDPLLVSGTDGVGTKLEVALQCGSHSGVGVDLVAMCVNDVLASGAEPLFFLDYFACGRLDGDAAAEIVAGVAEGCRQAGCALIGGETAEMPGMYVGGQYDLAGFAVGAVERADVLPRLSSVREGDVLLGLPSSGLHSNGFSLVRRIMRDTGTQYADQAPFTRDGRPITFGEEFLTPTRIYARGTLGALRAGGVKAVAHITGGGITGNVPRALPPGARALLDARRWPLPPVLGWLAAHGHVAAHEMLRTFNCGLGLVLVVEAGCEGDVAAALRGAGETVYRVGAVTFAPHPPAGEGEPATVEVANFVSVLEASMRPHVGAAVARRVPRGKRVGVLISGSGTNLQALLDATSDPSRAIGARLVLVVSNKPGVEGLRRADAAGIPSLVIRHQDFGSRLEFDLAVDAALTAGGVELVCLAGFMRVLTGEFVRRWRGRLLNIHPALLPLFKGVHAHRQALEAGVRLTGCTAHFVEEDVDAGAILVQEAVPVEPGDTEEILQERVKLAEHRVFPEALRLVATGRVRLGQDGALAWL